MSATEGKKTVPMKIATIGLAIAKSVFQVRRINAEGRIVLRRKVRRKDLLASSKNSVLAGQRHI